jgi:hypothetical protein
MSTTASLRELVASAQPLSTDERRRIVDQATLLIEQLYVHLPLKRAMHAVDPLQRLRLLDRRLDRMAERQFHDEMIEIFIGLRDLHTNYILPTPFRGMNAVLPFRVEEYWDGGKRHYLVTGVDPAATEPPFEPGVEVTHWNGIPMDRAVDLNGQRNGGSNLDARHARGLISMTHRPLALLAPPEEEWVDVTYLADGEAHEERFHWNAPAAPPVAPTGVDLGAADLRLAMSLGIDALTEAVRRAQKVVLAPEAMTLERAMSEGASVDLGAVSTMPDVLEFRRVPAPQGELGYLRIRTFSVADVDAFVAEVIRILDLLPDRGLIIDVRGNGGGVIMAGERLLQLLTPGTITPENMHFINTPVTLELAAIDGLEQWRDSIAESVETGSPFSDGLPIFPEHAEDCNRIGQRYHGPVVLITDALCYSTTDIFAAGFQDHSIGSILGTSGNTGAGGANVWTHELLAQLLPEQIQPLPRRASMRVAIRRTTRVGGRSGDPVEDLGIVPEQIHQMTRRDLLERNPDLIAAAAALLAGRPARVLETALAAPSNGAAQLSLRTGGLDRVDLYVDARPRATLDVADGDHAAELALGGAGPHVIEVRGFAGGKLAACRRLEG